MSNEFESLLEKLITLIVDKKTSASVSVGIASNIDKEENTCDVEIDEDFVIHGVRLSAVIDSAESRCIVYPKEDSQVLVIMIGKNKAEGFLLACSEVQEINLKIGDKSLKATSDGFVYNEGTDGLVKLSEMVSWMNKVYTDLTTLTGLLSTTTVAGNGTPLGIIFNPTTPAPVKTTFEDTKIKH